MVMGHLEAGVTARKVGSLQTLFSVTGILRIGELKTAVTSQINPVQALELVIWDRKWLWKR